MEIRNKILLTISWYIGLIAFIGGWTIFLVWAGSRYAGAWNFEKLEIVGFLWMAAFFWLSLVALALLIIYILLNRKRLHVKMFFAGILILINIPSVLIILPLQRKIENKVFVKLINHSFLENADFKLYGNLKNWEIGNIDNNTFKVFNYDPPYLNYDARLYQKPDTLNLIITHDGIKDTIGFPTLKMGSCRELIIHHNLKLETLR